MKKIIASFILFVVCIASNAQTLELTGCMGIKFGDPKEKVKQTLSAKNAGFKVYRDETKILSYTDGIFAGRDCIGAIFLFHNNKLHTIKILLKEDQQPKVLDLYETVRDEMESKYGITPTISHNFKSPYYEGDGYTVSAIKLGYAEIASYFYFQDGNVATVEITENLSVMCVYQNTGLAQQAIDENNQKRSQDY